MDPDRPGPQIDTRNLFVISMLFRFSPLENSGAANFYAEWEVSI
jgi:hypothetical protein